MYEKIIHDKDYLNMMEQIEKYRFIENNQWDWEHGFGHAQRVAMYVVRLLTDLQMSDEIIEMGAVAGLLHDIGLITGQKKNHAKKSAELAKQYLRRFKLTDQQKEMIVQAIEDHSNGNHIQSVIGAALLLADKIDVSHYRVFKSSIKDEINLEFYKVRNVEVKSYNDFIEILYDTENDFNPSILKYWIKWISKPILAARYFGKKCIFTFNGIPFDFT